MQEWDDTALLREYVARGSEESFATLVTRHVNKVYSVAFRYTRNPQQAEEITQVVFVILARKSPHLGKAVVISGWLYQTARLTAITFIRTEIRRARREQEAQMQNSLKEIQSDTWSQIAPWLDTAMGELNETDRHAIVLRYFDNKSMKEIGAVMGASEAAAKMRLMRAVEKMRRFFTKRGVVVPAAVLVAAISANSVQAAPAALAKTVTAIGVAKGVTASGSTPTLIKAALKLIAWTNAKSAIVIGVATILAVGTSATLVIQNQSKPGAYISRSSWAFAGYDDPESTLKTLMWAISRNDAKNIMASLTPACQEEFRQLGTNSKPPVSAEQFVIRKWVGKAADVTEFRILKQDVVSQEKILLCVSAKIDRKSQDQWLKLCKIDREWKCDDFDPRPKDARARINGRSGMPVPNPVFGGIGVTLELDEMKHNMQIKAVLPNSPASKAGLSSGLIVTAIDGVSTVKKTPAECVFLTRGLVGKTVLLELVNPERKETNKVELNRRRGTP